MLCPSDSYNRRPFMGSQATAGCRLGDNWARGNYAANAGLGYYVDSPDPTQLALCGRCPVARLEGLRAARRDGRNASVTMAQISDGASNTVLLGEIRAGVTTSMRGRLGDVGRVQCACGARRG